jgi:hypothetical protein
MLFLVLEDSTAFSDACIHSFPHVLCNGTVFVLHDSCVPETVHQMTHCRFVWHRKIGKCIPKHILAG